MSEEKQNRVRQELQKIFDEEEGEISKSYTAGSGEDKIASKEAKRKAKEMIDKCHSFALIFVDKEHHGAICGVSDPLRTLRALNKVRKDLHRSIKESTEDEGIF